MTDTNQPEREIKIGKETQVEGDVVAGDKTQITTGDIQGENVNIVSGDVTQEIEEYKVESGGTVIKAEAGATVIVGTQAGAGLQALNHLVQVSGEVREAVIAFSTDFEASCRQVDVMGDYKDLHDLLHQTQYHCYEPIATEAPRFPDETTLDMLDSYQRNLRDILTNLQSVAERKRVAEADTAWFQELIQACTELKNSVDDLDVSLLKKAIWRLKRVLTNQPVRINTRLIDAARTLRLASLLQAMTEINKNIAALKLDGDKVAQFQAGMEELSAMSQNLQALLQNHDAWQAIDVELRRIESLIEQDLIELEMSWDDLKKQAEPLYEGRSESWATSLQEDRQAVDDALGANNPPKVRRSFKTFRREAGSRFFQVDVDLKAQCSELRQIGEPLTNILQNLS